jgi:hypothetical protein
MDFFAHAAFSDALLARAASPAGTARMIANAMGCRLESTPECAQDDCRIGP